MSKNSALSTNNFGDVIRHELENNEDLKKQVESEPFNFDVATLIYNARKSANLTQEQLAKKAGTSQSVIARMEDADYDGHSLKMLRRLAAALDCRLQINFQKQPAR